jgi:hypothetical protein
MNKSKSPLILSFSPRGEGTLEAPSLSVERSAALLPLPFGERVRVRGRAIAYE